MILKNSEKKENNKFEFTVESDAAELSEAIRKVYLRSRKQISIPGFRKGKAPLALIENMYGKQVFDGDALDDLAQDAFDKGIEESKVEFIGRPSIVNAEVTEGRTALFTFVVELYPEVELGQYREIEVEKIPTEVTDEEVDAEIEKARKRNARHVTVDDRAAEKGDTANIDYEGFLDAEKTQPFDGGKGENHDLELGSGSFVPGFEDQVVGMKAGEEKDINITFPEDYSEDLAGKDVVFHVKVNSVTVPELPELDDDFAQDVSEYDTLDEYKAATRKELEEKKADQVKTAIRNAALEQACENMKAELPETMVKSHLESSIRNFASNYGINDPNMPIEKLASMMGLNEETMNSFFRPNAERETKLELLLRAIIEKENIAPSAEEITEYVKKTAESAGVTEDQLKKYYPEDYIAGELKKEKAISLITDSVVLVDELKKPEEAPDEKTPEEKTKAKKATRKPKAKAPAEEVPAEAAEGEAEA